VDGVVYQDKLFDVDLWNFFLGYLVLLEATRGFIDILRYQIRDDPIRDKMGPLPGKATQGLPP
jgi:hypothetical protein